MRDNLEPRPYFPWNAFDGLQNRVGNRQTVILAEKSLENQT
jgi:hypothetical protein